MSGVVEEVTVPSGPTLLTRHWERRDPKAVVVIVHGAADHSGRWGNVAEFFVESGYEVLGYDMRGHGRSSGRPMYVDTFDDFLSDLQAMLERAKASRVPVVVYGHSLGGLVALAYGVSGRPQPDLFVLSAPALDSTTPKALRALAYLFGGILPTLTAPTAIKKEQLSTDPVVGEAYLADPHVHKRSSFRLGKEAFRAMARTKRQLDRLVVPTLVVHGEADDLVPARVSAPLGRLSVVERVVFSDLRHELHNEPEAETVLAHITRWLDRRLTSDE